MVGGARSASPRGPWCSRCRALPRPGGASVEVAPRAHAGPRSGHLRKAQLGEGRGRTRCSTSIDHAATSVSPSIPWTVRIAVPRMFRMASALRYMTSASSQLSDVLLYLVRLADVPGVELTAAAHQRLRANAARLVVADHLGRPRSAHDLAGRTPGEGSGACSGRSPVGVTPAPRGPNPGIRVRRVRNPLREAGWPGRRPAGRRRSGGTGRCSESTGGWC